jgi:hypothetical protein
MRTAIPLLALVTLGRRSRLTVQPDPSYRRAMKRLFLAAIIPVLAGCDGQARISRLEAEVEEQKDLNHELRAELDKAREEIKEHEAWQDNVTLAAGDVSDRAIYLFKEMRRFHEEPWADVMPGVFSSANSLSDACRSLNSHMP